MHEMWELSFYREDNSALNGELRLPSAWISEVIFDIWYGTTEDIQEQVRI